MDLVAIVLTLGLLILASGSHAGVCIGLASAVGVLRGARGLAVYTVTLLMGALLQGYLMEQAVVEPSLCSLATTLGLSVVPSLTGIPLSINFGLYASQIGCALAISRIYVLMHTIACWILMTLLTAVLAIVIAVAVMRMLTSRRRIDLTLKISRISILVLAIAYTFAVGANTFGYIVAILNHLVRDRAVAILTMVVGIVVGAIVLSRASVERIAYRFYGVKYGHALNSLLVSTLIVEVSTFMSIPMSASLVVVTALVATSAIARIRIVDIGNYFKYLVTQFLAIPMALFIGPLMARILP